jgi:hypothetical protein
MFQRKTENRTVLLLIGMIAGLCLASMWPHEPALAAATDRSSKFAILTVPVGVLERSEGVFILDFLTGRLSGAVLNNRTGTFTHRYSRNLAADFGRIANPQYAIVGGQATLPNRGRMSFAGGAIYVAEMTSGKFICYGFPYSSANKQLPELPLVKIADLQFRAPSLE